MPRSRMKPRTLPSSSLAHTIIRSAIGAWVIQVLLPERRYPPCARRARVVMLPGSEPWSGSVRPKQPSFSARAIAGR